MAAVRKPEILKVVEKFFNRFIWKIIGYDS